jgi:KDO2-lipid IV(A) lauroyltransferase
VLTTFKFQSYSAYLLLRLVLALLRALPYSIASVLLDQLAHLIFRIDAKHRRIARINLCIAFPELSDRDHDRIARKSFQNLARNLLELSRYHRLTADNIASRVAYDPDSGLNNYEAARAKSNGILYLTGHFSAWELLPTAHALHGYPLSFVTRPLDNPYLEKYLRSFRETAGNKVIAKKNSARQVLSVLKVGGGVGILMDQNTGLNEGTFADFFGMPAGTTTSVALLALRTEATVLPGYLTPRLHGRYAIKFLPPVELIRSGNLNSDIQANTELFNKILERIVREQPETWLWGHKRWKLQPPGQAQDLYGIPLREARAFVSELKKTRK